MSQDSFDPPVVIKIYKTYQIFIPLLANFPKPQRYTLGQVIDRSLLSMLEYIFEANAMPLPLRESLLLRAMAKCELTKILIRLSCESSIINNTQYFQLMSNLQEVGKMLGGWIKYIRHLPVK
ncbi:MAG: four helix bundle protein [Patescibacteria group bacterium]